ncbi:MAG: CsbD family protein [Immundisolibacteraceae bacterium]|nr:CsbD family protein [Immundisolibacteraceae bacterium]
MDNEKLKGNWNIVKGKVKEQWGKLTDDDIDRVGGQFDQLVGEIQKRYGITREEAEREIRDWRTVSNY